LKHRHQQTHFISESDAVKLVRRFEQFRPESGRDKLGILAQIPNHVYIFNVFFRNFLWKNTKNSIDPQRIFDIGGPWRRQFRQTGKTAPDRTFGWRKSARGPPGTFGRRTTAAFRVFHRRH